MNLYRSITPFALLSTAIGGMLGSGWLFGPFYAVQLAGPAAILSWGLGGFLMLLIGLTFAELSAAFPIASGMTRFAEMTHDSLVTFTVSWMTWLSSVVVAPIETLALLQYAANYIPGLLHHHNDAIILSPLGASLAAVLMLVMCLINRAGAFFFSRINTYIVILKLFVPTLTILVLLFTAFHPQNFQNLGQATLHNWHGILEALPAAGVIFSFIGYSPAIQLGGEARNPQTAIPFAIIASLLTCIVIYVLLQIAFIGAVNPEQLHAGWGSLHFAGIYGPISGLVQSLGLAWLLIFIYASAFVSPFGTALTYTAATARTNYAMAKQGFFPEFMMTLSKHHVPLYAIAINYFIGLLLLLPFPGWKQLVEFLVSCIVLAYMIGPIALVCLRHSLPHYPRPFKLPFGRVIALLAFYVCNLLVYWTGWETLFWVLIALLVGYTVFFISIHTKKMAKVEINWRLSWWLAPYLVGVATISYLGNFGGGIKRISFGWDFFWLAIFTMIIFTAAVLSSKKTTFAIE